MRGDVPIALLALLAAASVLCAPVLGRFGWPALAEGAMWLAAGAGVASFACAGAATFRAARRRAPRSTAEQGGES